MSITLWELQLLVRRECAVAVPLVCDPLFVVSGEDEVGLTVAIELTHSSFASSRRDVGNTCFFGDISDLEASAVLSPDSSDPQDDAD